MSIIEWKYENICQRPLLPLKGWKTMTIKYFFLPFHLKVLQLFFLGVNIPLKYVAHLKNRAWLFWLINRTDPWLNFVSLTGFWPNPLNQDPLDSYPVSRFSSNPIIWHYINANHGDLNNITKFKKRPNYYVWFTFHVSPSYLNVHPLLYLRWGSFLRIYNCG